jgi:hypothetical protein
MEVKNTTGVRFREKILKDQQFFLIFLFIFILTKMKNKQTQFLNVINEKCLRQKQRLNAVLESIPILL